MGRHPSFILLVGRGSRQRTMAIPWPAVRVSFSGFGLAITTRLYSSAEKEEGSATGPLLPFLTRLRGEGKDSLNA